MTSAEIEAVKRSADHITNLQYRIERVDAAFEKHAADFGKSLAAKTADLIVNCLSEPDARLLLQKFRQSAVDELSAMNFPSCPARNG